jgi:predicted NBD/HSP70 family sugar kinase
MNRRSGINLLRVKDYNQVLVLDIVRNQAPVSRREIADRSGLRFQSVSNIAERLIQSGIVVEDERGARQGARIARRLSLNENAAYALGIHIDRESVSVALTNIGARIVESKRSPMPAESRPESVLPIIQRHIEQVIAAAGISEDRILGAGIGLPGPLDVERGCLLRVPNFGDWDHFPLRDKLSDLLNMPVYLDSDTTAATLGEQWRGVGRNVANFIYVFLGPGIGAGIVLNGRACRGRMGNIGQIGHVQVEPDGPPCYCGKRGCLEVYATPWGILREAGRVVLEQAPSSPAPDRTLPQSLDDILARPEPEFTGVLEAAAERLGRCVSAMVGILDPELVVLGGSMMVQLGPLFLKAVEEMLPASSMPSKQLPRVEVSTLGPNAGMIGAASLVLHSVYSLD